MKCPAFTILRAFALAILFGLASPAIAVAQAVVSTGDSFITPRLLPGSILPDGGRMAGLRLSLEPGWKTYWRSPGETGIPPRFDWTGSQNIRALQIHWPRPALFESFGMQTAGYSDVVLFPLELVPEDPSAPMLVQLSADLGVCKEICVLEHVKVALRIEPDHAEIGARQIRSALRKVPKPAMPEIAHMAACRIERDGRIHRLTASLVLGERVSRPIVLVESEQGLWIRRTTQASTASGLDVKVEFSLPKGVSWVDRSAFRMTILSDPVAYDLQGCRAN